MRSSVPYVVSLRTGVHACLPLRTQDCFSLARSGSHHGSHGSVIATCSTPTLNSSSDVISDSGVLPGFNDISQFARTLQA